MPILLTNFNVVYPKSIINSLYNEGLEQFKKDLGYGKGEKDSEDDFLLSFACMNYTDSSPEGFELDKDYAIIGKWQQNNSCEWLLDNGLYFWHRDYQDTKSTNQKYLSQSITVGMLEEYLKSGSLPIKF